MGLELRATDRKGESIERRLNMLLVWVCNIGFVDEKEKHQPDPV